jgi:hypothetical protein
MDNFCLCFLGLYPFSAVVIFWTNLVLSWGNFATYSIEMVPELHHLMHILVGIALCNSWRSFILSLVGKDLQYDQFEDLDS